MNWHIGDEAGGNMRGLLNHPGKEMPKKVNYQLLLKHKCLSFFLEDAEFQLVKIDVCHNAVFDLCWIKYGGPDF